MSYTKLSINIHDASTFMLQLICMYKKKLIYAMHIQREYFIHNANGESIMVNTSTIYLKIEYTFLSETQLSKH